jgi:5S rRNA maturation endonuclease (ribonuclease M5)
MADSVENDFDGDIITFASSEIKEMPINEIPKDAMVEIADLGKGGVYHSKFEGEFGWSNGAFCAFVRNDWYRKYWDLPLGLAYHMDLMKRLAEFRSAQNKDVIDIEFQDDGDWCHLNYTILIPEKCVSVEDALNYANIIINWIDATVQTAQDGASDLINTIVTKYNETSLLELPDLIQKVITTKDTDEKGKYLEELIARFFAEIKGFHIIERKRTKTEEIDLVIINNSDQDVWRSESNLILVECKNWSKKPAGKNEYVAFKEKLANRRGRAKLGFFISGKGFAKTFGLEDLRNSKDDLLIVPIDLKQIINILENHGDHSKELQNLYVAATTK